MNIIRLPTGNRIDLKDDSDLKKARVLFDSGEYTVSVTALTEINNTDFFGEFIEHFGDIKELAFSGYGEAVSYDFLYKMNNLEKLHISVLYPIDFKKLTNLKEISLMWNKKLIFNFDQLTQLEHLVISEFDEIDLSKLSNLTQLRTLSFKTARIKSLNGIEQLTNLKCLSFGGVRNLTDISGITSLLKLKFLEFDIAWKLQNFSPISELQELEVLKIIDCKNLASIKFVKDMPKLRQLYTLGTTVINDYDTTAAEHLPIFFGSLDKKYNKIYLEKEIMEGQKTWSSYS